MRTLQLSDPQMAGPDALDWQTFLKKKNLFASRVDGLFGPVTDAATRGYQTGAGLLADGVVGQKTMSRAIADGYQCSTGANIAGLDANTNCTGFIDHITSDGVQFAARYYSNAAAKTITAAEAQALSAAGIKIVIVFENFNNAIDKFSAAVGSAQAAKALQLAKALGQPAGSAIYFAVDFDPSQADVSGAISDYFRAVKTAFSAAGNLFKIGVYGSGLTCRLIRDAGLAQLTWLAQSTGFREYAAFRPNADIVQLSPSRSLNGLNIDDNIAQNAEFGGFTLPLAQEATTTD